MFDFSGYTVCKKCKYMQKASYWLDYDCDRCKAAPPYDVDFVHGTVTLKSCKAVNAGHCELYEEKK